MGCAAVVSLVLLAVGFNQADTHDMSLLSQSHHHPDTHHLLSTRSNSMRTAASVGTGLDSFTVTKFVYSEPAISISDCDPNLLNKYTAQFAALKATDGTEFLGHIVSDDELNCFTDIVSQVTGRNLKQCLEYADGVMDDSSTANSFIHSNSDGDCIVYENWRQHKFRQCKRGTIERMLYLRRDTPSGYDACADVTLSLDADYTATGSVMSTITATNYCCCEITRVTYQYLGTTYTLDATTYPYTYTYPADDTGYLNATTVQAYASNSLVAELVAIIPGDSL